MGRSHVQVLVGKLRHAGGGDGSESQLETGEADRLRVRVLVRDSTTAVRCGPGRSG